VPGGNDNAYTYPPDPINGFDLDGRLYRDFGPCGCSKRPAKHNSGHQRQYELMRNAGLIVFGPDTMPGGKWVTPRFVDTPDNREALKLARELLAHGELVEHRVEDTLARAALQSDRSYVAPMQTAHRVRKNVQPTARQFDKIFEAAMGTRSL
jgi:hypothetical protein